MSAVKARRPREVELAYVGRECWWYMGRQPKVTLTFSIIEPEAGFGESVQAHYRVSNFDHRKRCFAKPRSKLNRDLGRLFPDYKHESPLPLGRLKGCTMIGKTRWVNVDGNGVPIAAQQQYEIIEYLLRRTNG